MSRFFVEISIFTHPDHSLETFIKKTVMIFEGEETVDYTDIELPLKKGYAQYWEKVKQGGKTSVRVYDDFTVRTVKLIR